MKFFALKILKMNNYSIVIDKLKATEFADINIMREKSQLIEKIKKSIGIFNTAKHSAYEESKLECQPSSSQDLESFFRKI